MPDNDDYPIKAFADPEKLRAWLEKNHAKSIGLWLRFFKKNSKKKSVTYDEALDIALCFGWIDSQMNKYDDISYIQKFTPRRARSMWSKRNREKCERLTRENLMTQAGLDEIAAAKLDGRWDRAYDSPKDMAVPIDFLEELKKNKDAFKFFDGLPKQYKFGIAFRLQSARRPETREKRFRNFLELLKKGEKPL